MCALLNSKTFDFGVDLVHFLHSHLNEALAKATPRKLPRIKALLRFTAALANVNVVSADSMLDLFISMIDNFCANLSDTSSPQEQAYYDAIVYAIVAALPHCPTVVTNAEHQQKAYSLETKISDYLLTISTSTDMPLTRVFKQGSSADQLRTFWRCVQPIFSDPDTNVPFEWFTDIEMADFNISDSVPHDFPAVDHHHLKYFPASNATFVGYQGTFSSVTKPTLAYVLIRDLVVECLNLYEHNRRECANMLSRLGYFFSVNEADQIILNTVECILMELLSLPSSEQKPVYYASVLFELMKVEGFPSALGKTMRAIFARLDASQDTSEASDMDLECLKRLSTWFSHHLSNFGFIWKWTEWESIVTDLTLASTKRFLFIKYALEMLTRFAYYERVKGTLPAAYIGTIYPESQPRPDFKFAHDDSGVNDAAAELLSFFRTKSTEQEREACLNKMREVIQSEEKIREIVLHALFMAGSKSFSHMLNIFERFAYSFYWTTDL